MARASGREGLGRFGTLGFRFGKGLVRFAKFALRFGLVRFSKFGLRFGKVWVDSIRLASVSGRGWLGLVSLACASVWLGLLSLACALGRFG